MHPIETLYMKQYGPAVGMMYRMTKDYAAAEDVVQEAFCRAWKFFPAYDEEKAKLSTWFNAILFNALRDYQKEMRNGPTPYTPEISAESFLEDIKDKDIRREFLMESINQMGNPIHRDVVELFFINGYTSTEISQIVPKMTQSNVTTILNRFKEGLK